MRRFLLSFSLFMFSCAVYAQDAQGDDSFDSATDAIIGLYADMVALVQVILGLLAAVLLVMVVKNIMSGERESASKLGWWLLGLVLGFIVLGVLKDFFVGA